MRTNIEGDWFRVYVGTEAEFIAFNYSEDHAIDAVKWYCDENKFLGLDPTMMLPHGTIGKPLQPIESRMHSEISNDASLFTPRLVNFRQNLPLLNNEKIFNRQESIHANQLALFGLRNVSSFRLATKASDYSYFDQ